MSWYVELDRDGENTLAHIVEMRHGERVQTFSGDMTTIVYAIHGLVGDGEVTIDGTGMHMPMLQQLELLGMTIRPITFVRPAVGATVG